MLSAGNVYRAISRGQEEELGPAPPRSVSVYADLALDLSTFLNYALANFQNSM